MIDKPNLTLILKSENIWEWSSKVQSTSYSITWETQLIKNQSQKATYGKYEQPRFQTKVFKDIAKA